MRWAERSQPRLSRSDPDPNRSPPALPPGLTVPLTLQGGLKGMHARVETNREVSTISLQGALRAMEARKAAKQELASIKLQAGMLGLQARQQVAKQNAVKVLRGFNLAPIPTLTIWPYSEDTHRALTLTLILALTGGPSGQFEGNANQEGGTS